MSHVTFRTALESDVEMVIQFWNSYGENHSRPVDSPEALHALLTRDPKALLLAFDATTLVGTVIAGWDGWRASIYRLAVHPDSRTLGIARELVEGAITRFRSLGASRVGAVVLDDNELGVKTWSALGFTRQAEWSRWVKDI